MIVVVKDEGVRREQAHLGRLVEFWLDSDHGTGNPGSVAQGRLLSRTTRFYGGIGERSRRAQKNSRPWLRTVANHLAAKNNSRASPDITGIAGPRILSERAGRVCAWGVRSGTDGLFAFAHPFGSLAATDAGARAEGPIALRPHLSMGLPFRG